MRSFSESRIMLADAKLVCDVVMDIEKYPEFIPWCSDAKILSDCEDFLLAELFVEFKGFKESYVSKVKKSYEKGEYKIEVVAISGVFRILNNVWVIKQLDNATKVDFSIDFEFKSRILEVIIGMIFSVATEKMIGAFEERIAELSNKL